MSFRFKIFLIIIIAFVFLSLAHFALVDFIGLNFFDNKTVMGIVFVITCVLFYFFLNLINKTIKIENVSFFSEIWAFLSLIISLFISVGILGGKNLLLCIIISVEVAWVVKFLIDIHDKKNNNCLKKR